MNLVPLLKQRREPLYYLFTHRAGADRQLNLEYLTSHSDNNVNVKAKINRERKGDDMQKEK